MYLCDTCYLLLCMEDCLVCRVDTRQSFIQNNKYQVSHKYSYFSWWWAHSRLKYVEKRNKHTKKNCAPSWLYLQDYTGMNGQQNIKYNFIYCLGSDIDEWYARLVFIIARQRIHVVFGLWFCILFPYIRITSTCTVLGFVALRVTPGT